MYQKWTFSPNAKKTLLNARCNDGMGEWMDESFQLIIFFSDSIDVVHGRNNTTNNKITMAKPFEKFAAESIWPHVLFTKF